MALRHKIHPNTVSEAYKDLVQRHWIKRHRGKKMVVRPFDALDHPVEDLDDLIDDTIRAALKRGYTLQKLRKRVRERLLIKPPDHVLIVEDEPGMRRLLRWELSEMLPLLTFRRSLSHRHQLRIARRFWARRGVAPRIEGVTEIRSGHKN